MWRYTYYEMLIQYAKVTKKTEIKIFIEYFFVILHFEEVYLRHCMLDISS